MANPAVDCRPYVSTTMIAVFTPIKLHDYFKIHLRANPGAMRAEVVRQLESAITPVRAGALCQCGAQIWVIGSSQSGLGCFRCITGQPEPDKDYEISFADKDIIN